MIKISVKTPSASDWKRIERELVRKAKQNVEREVFRKTGKKVKWVKK